MSYVVVRLAGGRFGLPMADVAEVGRLPWLTRVPGTPEWVAGVANWRGRILGVLDLRLLVGVGGPEMLGLPAGRLVLLQRGPTTVGIVAEKVEGVIEIADEDIEPTLVTLGGSAESLLLGQTLVDGDPVALVDTGAVFGLRNRIATIRRAG